MSAESISQRPEGPVDLNELLARSLGHMQQQNELQMELLIKTDAVIHELRRTNIRTNLLILAAIILLVMGGIQQAQVYEFQQEQQQARERFVMLEQSLNDAVAAAQKSVVNRVDQLAKTSPRVVTDRNGDLSLSVPVAPAPSSALPVTPVPTLRPHRTPFQTPAPAKPAPAGSDFVLVPLKAVE